MEACSRSISRHLRKEYKTHYMSKTYHKKRNDFDDIHYAKKIKFSDRRKKRKKVHADKTSVMDTYITEHQDEDADLSNYQ